MNEIRRGTLLATNLKHCQDAVFDESLQDIRELIDSENQEQEILDHLRSVPPPFTKEDKKDLIAMMQLYYPTTNANLLRNKVETAIKLFLQDN